MVYDKFQNFRTSWVFFGVCRDAEGQGIGGGKIRIALPNVDNFDRSVYTSRPFT
jgi:hypothetical protein